MANQVRSFKEQREMYFLRGKKGRQKKLRYIQDRLFDGIVEYLSL